MKVTQTMINHICRVDSQAGGKEETEKKKGRKPPTKQKKNPIGETASVLSRKPQNILKKFSYHYAPPLNSLCDEVKMNMTAVFPQIKGRTVIKRRIIALFNHAQ